MAKKVDSKKKSKLPLSKTHPEIAKRAYKWDPKLYSAGSRQKVSWKCKKGHIFNSEIRNASTSKSKVFCPVCNGHQILKGFNDLSTTDPKVAVEAYEWDPTTVTRGSNKKRKFLCKNGHVYEAIIASRTLEKTGCRICKNQVLVEGFNDLTTKDPELALEAFGWDPKTFVFGSAKKVDWKCKKGHVWNTSITSRYNAKNGCPYCSGFKTLAGFNDIETTHPKLALEAFGWDPKKIHAGTNKKLKWKCKLGHIWDASGTSRSAMDTGCPYCANFTVLTGFNDLSTTRPDLAVEADGWNPKKVIAGSNKIYKWKCEKGHKWKSSVVNRAHGKQTSCPTCAKTGFDPNKDAWIYLMENSELELMQVGITNSPRTRLAKHSKSGWELLDLRGPIEGALAKEWEKGILKMVKNRINNSKKKSKISKFDGYTEAWEKSIFQANSVKELMKLTEEFEEIKGTKK